MKINNTAYHTIWEKDLHTICIIDQRPLPHYFVIEELKNLQDACDAIQQMHVRGAPLIGVTAAYGFYLGLLSDKSLSYDEIASRLKATRPTAVDLQWAVDQILIAISQCDSKKECQSIALRMSRNFKQLSIDACKSIGKFGLEIIKELGAHKDGPVNILTHCNAGWMACIDYGTATAPIYMAHQAGIDVHVWVDETRPRNQGARITAFELLEEGIAHTVIPDNTGGHLMQHGMVDMVIVGTDRTTRCGDVGNKIGTYLKALAAYDNEIPFYVAAPSSSIDWNIRDGLKEIPIEERNADEIRFIQGWEDDSIKQVLITPKDSPTINYGFDVTPAKYVTGIITERGIANANEESLLSLFPEQA
ncbi:MAG: S-methyl-5-thioribose-1-phosphate isomerase [Bacteroidota bacterium]